MCEIKLKISPFWANFPRFSGCTQPEVAGKYLKWSKFNSAHREHSIEGCNITVALVEPKLVKFTQKEAFFTRFSGFTEPEVGWETGNGWNPTQLIKSRP